MIFKNHKGFTLIELMVSVSIISILAATVLVNLNSARLKGTDAKFSGDTLSLRNAFALYDNVHGSGPFCNPSTIFCSDFGGSTNFDTILQPLIREGTISVVTHYSGWPAYSANGSGSWLYQTYVSAMPNSLTGLGYNAEVTCDPTATYANWHPGTYPQGIITIQSSSDHTLPLPQGYMLCQDYAGNPGCFWTPPPSNAKLYCLQLY